ncbi:MAG: tetratricopeptide repeat protein [Deltaproteobacteria bacterium]|nr:tetratricopeptide repeat protein [Deltaproteobacteria bacterium]
MVRSLLLGRFGWCWIFLLPLAVLVQPVAAGERADRLWDLANHLYDKQDYYRALTEYQRFVFLFSEDQRNDQAKLQIGRCYRREGETNKAFSYLIRLYKSTAEKPIGPEILLEMIAIRQDQGRNSRAVYWTKQFIERYPDCKDLDTVYLSLAWLQIDSGKYDSAVATLERIQPESAHYSTARSLRGALQQRPEVGQRSPTMAGALSAVLPGSGHLYAGRPAQAASSFLLNALFITGAVLAFEHDSPALGGILVFFEMGWYVGGIRSAVQAVREENQKEEIHYRRELKEKYRLSFGLEPRKDRLALYLRLSF